MKDSYRNPFAGVNAVQLTEEKILEYWCNPFRYNLFTEIKEQDIYEDEMNIVIMGGRSTGKSMFLRYWSFPVQMKIAEREHICVDKIFQQNKGIGFYFRIDGPKLKSFNGQGLDSEFWVALFTNYFELIVGRQYLEVLVLLEESATLNETEIKTTLLPGLCNITACDEKNTVKEVLLELDNRIKEVETYLGNVPFYKTPFQPNKIGYLSQSLSFGIPNFLIENISFFNDINFIILLDEYENFLDYQQKVVNTLLKFTAPQIKFRIGMRLEGFRTFEMISEDDFIKVGREYREVILEEILNIKQGSGYINFLMDVSKKRLELIPILLEKGYTDIRTILTKKENLEKDALEIVKGKEDTIAHFFASNKKLNPKDIEAIRCPENPLLEIMNCIWLMRGKSVAEIRRSMEDYLLKKKTDDAKKYQNDYVNKYKLSLAFLLCSIYRTNKPYYSFNTFAYLSSGIVGHFIELCRISFDEAGWGDNDKLLNDGIILKEFQNMAAHKLSDTEKRQINRIETYGGLISRFIENLGNIFRHYHLDFKMRYPETNQFAINIDAIRNPEAQKALRSAIKWTIIQRKPKLQRSGPGEGLQDLYTINRIFSPSFQISYRTRGGKSVLLNESLVNRLLNDEKINVSDFLIEEDSYKSNDRDGLKDLFSGI
jgi:hypothetical protein